MCPGHAEVNVAATLGGTLQVLTSLALIIIVYTVGTYKWKRRHLEKLAAKLPGPPALPIVGNALEFVGNPQGALYGMLSMKTTISTLVRNYRFYSDIRTEDIKLRADLLLRSVNGYPVRIVNRK